jgi:DNA-binding response OmpR family regulator
MSLHYRSDGYFLMTGPKVGNPPPQSSHVLVVDDDSAIRNMVVRVLGTSYRVSAAADPHEALATAGREAAIDLLILDVMMPGMNGFELAKRLRLLPSCAKARYMFLTARDTPADRIKGIQSGACSYVTKPFTINDLIARVNKALNR